MNIEVVCPYCRFSKKVPKEKIPLGAKKAVCPLCGQPFAFSLNEEGTRLETARINGGSSPVKPVPDLPEKPIRIGAPWERMSEAGTWQGIYRTWRAVLGSPVTFFRSLAFAGRLKDPFAFGLLFGAVGGMFGLFWQVATGSGPFGLGAIERLSPGSIFGVMMVAIPVAVAMGLVVYSVLIHLFLRVVRAGKNGYRATSKVIYYSQAVQVWSVIPFVGSIIGGIWQLIIQVIGLREIHETSYTRVILAYLIPLAFVLFLGVMVLIALSDYIFR